MFLDSEPGTNIYGECPKESYMDKILKDELEPPAYSKPSSFSLDNLEFDLSNINPDKLADGSYPMFHDKGYAGSIMKGLFGYNGDPSMIELLAWFSAVAGLGFMWKKASAA